MVLRAFSSLGVRTRPAPAGVVLAPAGLGPAPAGVVQRCPARVWTPSGASMESVRQTSQGRCGRIAVQREYGGRKKSRTLSRALPDFVQPVLGVDVPDCVRRCPAPVRTRGWTTVWSQSEQRFFVRTLSSARLKCRPAKYISRDGVGGSGTTPNGMDIGMDSGMDIVQRFLRSQSAVSPSQEEGRDSNYPMKSLSGEGFTVFSGLAGLSLRLTGAVNSRF